MIAHLPRVLFAILGVLLLAPAASAAERKAAILYSATSRDNYFDQFSYYQAYMAAQHQCTMAGIPFELLDESALADDANLAAYDVLIIPHFTHVEAAVRSTYITQLGQAAAAGLNIVAADWLMVYDENNQTFSQPGLANETILGVAWSDFNGPVMANLKAADAAHPALPGYLPNETILTYDQLWADQFSPTALADPAGTTAYATLVIEGETFRAVNAVTTTSGNRNVHFTNAQIMLDSNLLWSAIHWALYGDEAPVALRAGRQRSLFFARNDMDQSMFPFGVQTVETPLLDIITDWKADHDFVGTYYLNVGDDPDNFELTDWAVSGPLYQDYMALGSEIGTHSYTHPHFIKDLNAAELEFEFKDSAEVIGQELGITVNSAAVPGNPETPNEIELISQWLPHLSGRSAISDSDKKLTSAFGFLRPGFPMFYSCLNTSPDFTLVGFLGFTAEEAAAIWQTEVDNLHEHAPLPVVHWLWHDYGPTETEPGFTREMFDTMVAHAASYDTEFITAEDFRQRNLAIRNGTLEVSHPDPDTIQVTVGSPGGLGTTSLQLDASETITAVDDWPAWDGHKVFLPANGGTFTIRTGGTPGDAPRLTRLTRLPARAELLSASGNETALHFSFRGSGTATVSIPAGFQLAGDADAVLPNGDQWDLVYTGEGPHSTTLIANTPGSEFVDLVNTSLDGTLFTLEFTSLPGLSGWALLGSPDLTPASTTDLTPQATITEPTPGTYTATIDISTLGDTHFFQVGMEGTMVP